MREANLRSEGARTRTGSIARRLSLLLGTSLLTLFGGSARADELIVNGGFETGDFTAWTSSASNATTGGCDVPWVVGSNGSATGCVTVSGPISGNFAAYSSFDGNGPQTFSLRQSFAVPSVIDQAQLQYWLSYQAGYSGQNRTLQVILSNGATSQTVTLFTLPKSTGIQTQQFTADVTSALSSFAGQTVTLDFVLFMPENFTGGAGIMLDNVSLNVVGDATPPALSITGPSAVQNAPFTVNFNFSENVTGFTASDVGLTNLSLSNFTGAGASYSATATPLANGPFRVVVNPNAAQDTAGNNLALPASYDGVADITRPSVVVSGPAGPVSGNFAATVAFSESVDGFTADDLQLSNATIVNFNGSLQDYTVTLAPITDGPVSVTVADGAADDTVNTNTVSNTFTVTADFTPPVVSVPANITVGTDAGQASAVVTYSVSASDPGHGALTPVLLSGPASGAAFPLGTTVVTYRATDAAGLVTTESFNVTVEDNEFPALVGMPANIAVNTDPGLATAIVSWTPPSVSDNAAGASITQTAGPAPGAAFPIGVTTITYKAEDAAGNTTSESFTVTVQDAEPPAFTGFPSDIVITVDYPDTSAVASWSAPGVTDNAPGATVAQIAGPASGASFPLGATTITYRAQDGAGTIVDQSFTVTVQQTPPGQVRLVIRSGADGAFVFTSPEPDFNLTINTSGGDGDAVVNVRPGLFNLAFAAPSGFGVLSADCDDTNSTLSASAQTGLIDLASNEVITCTIVTEDALNETSRLIGAFVGARAQLILQNMPDADRRIDRLNARAPASGGVSGFGLSALRGQAPFDLSFGDGRANFSFSLAGMRANGAENRAEARAARERWGDGEFDAEWRGQPRAYDFGDFGAVEPIRTSYAASERGGATSTDETPRANAAPGAAPMTNAAFDLWIEGAYARFDTAAGDGDFYMLSAGVDWLTSPDLLFGLSVQTDWTDMNGPLADASMQGRGYLVGPYMTARLAEGFYFDGQVAFGQSFNQVSPFGLYEDDVDAERAYASAALIGEVTRGAWTFQPEGRVTYFREETDAYTDTLNVFIPSIAVETGVFEFSPTIRYRRELASQAVFEPFVTLEGVWTFSQSNSAAFALGNGESIGEGLRGRFEAGFGFVRPSGMSLSAMGFYDGIGEADYAAWGAQLRMSWSFD